jgi:hypothetical protein
LAPDGITRLGWDQVRFDFTGMAHCLTVNDFLLSPEAAEGPAPTIVDLEIGTGGLDASIVFEPPIEAGSWLRVYQPESVTAVRFGSLPGDVDASRMSTPFDILALIDQLNGGLAPGPEWSTDIDRSQIVDPGDVTTLIALLEGTIGGEAWLGETLP